MMTEIEQLENQITKLENALQTSRNQETQTKRDLRDVGKRLNETANTLEAVRENWRNEVEGLEAVNQHQADEIAALRAALVEIMHRTPPLEPVLQPGQVRFYIEQYVGWKFGQIARQALAAYPKAKTEDGDGNAT